MAEFSSLNRLKVITNFQQESLDLLIIGGGITGAGISLDATQRGLRTGLIEMQDFAAGTSSRSTKLVHGGLRYLKQFEVGLVAEVGQERAIVYENGPHVTTPEWMMLPFYKGGTFGPFSTSIGLRVYDLLAGVKKSERRKMFSPSEAMEKEPLLAEKDLKGAGYYVEYKTDDARLTIEVIKKAVELGAIACNYLKAIEFIYKNGKVIGIMAEDQITGEAFPIYAKKIINATGPWVDELREIDGSKQGKRLHLTKGVHLVFSKQDFPLQQAIYFDSEDGRMIFAIPRDNKTYVGTTDTTYEGDIAHPTLTVEDQDYLLGAINSMFPTLKLTFAHVESSWAGLRPLIAEEGKKPGEISRKDEVFISKSGLLSMAGGKLTGYRKMAKDIVDEVVKELKDEEGILYTSSETRYLPISGGEVGGSEGFKVFTKQKVKCGVEIGLTKEEALNLIRQYGTNVETIFRLFKERTNEALENAIEPITFAELVYALDYEMAFTPADFFIRRTGSLFFDKARVEQQRVGVTNYMAKSLQWSKDQTIKYEQELTKLLQESCVN